MLRKEKKKNSNVILATDLCTLKAFCVVGRRENGFLHVSMEIYLAVTSLLSKRGFMRVSFSLNTGLYG